MNEDTRRRKSYSVTPISAAEKAAMDKSKTKIPGTGSTSYKMQEAIAKEDDEKGIDANNEKPAEINIMTLFNLLQESMKFNATNHKSLEDKIKTVASVETKLEEVKSQNAEIRGLVAEIETKNLSCKN